MVRPIAFDPLANKTGTAYMKIVTYLDKDNCPVPGVLSSDSQRIIHLGDEFADVLALIDAGPAGLEYAAKRLVNGGQSIPLATTELLAPIPVPRQFRDFNNHPQHMRDVVIGIVNLRAELAGEPRPPRPDKATFQVAPIYRRQPIFYFTNRYSISGQGAGIQRPSYCNYLDYELELAVILGRGGKDIPEDQAGDHIFGYTIFNDFSARDQQMAEMESNLGPAKGKSFDGGNVLGPWIVTKDEMPDPFAMKVAVRVNGQVMGENTGKEMIYSFEQMIAFVSRSETVHAGEVFGSGTYGGCCGVEIDYFLKDGDIVELEIEGIGILRNRVLPAAK